MQVQRVRCPAHVHCPNLEAAGAEFGNGAGQVRAANYNRRRRRLGAKVKLGLPWGFHARPSK